MSQDGLLKRAKAPFAAAASTLVILSSQQAIALPTVNVLQAQELEPPVTATLRELDKAARSESSDQIFDVLIKLNDITTQDADGVMEDNLAREAIVSGLGSAKQAAGGRWNSEIDFGASVLIKRLDPFRIVALRPVLQVAPFIGGAAYLAVFFVQQAFPALFPLAYFLGVAVVALPIAFTFFFA